jgi:hypothetical protein
LQTCHSIGSLLNSVNSFGFSNTLFPNSFFVIFAADLSAIQMKIPVTHIMIAFALIVSGFFTGCKTTGLTNEQQLKQFKKMDWLAGRWQNVNPETSMTEVWKKENDTIFSGISTLLFGPDTIYSENIVLAPSGFNIYYTIISHSNNKTGNSSYVLKKNQCGVLVFEDPGNKLQSRITYSRKSKDNILLKVEGLDEGKLTTEVYNLKRAIK